MQVLDQAWSNFRDSINSDKTLQVYEYCLQQFLLNCNLDLESLLKLLEITTATIDKPYHKIYF